MASKHSKVIIEFTSHVCLLNAVLYEPEGVIKDAFTFKPKIAHSARRKVNIDANPY